jgi:2'-5' RNA ligase
METLRLFVAVDPPPAVRERLRAAMATVRPLAPRARWVDADKHHLTLAFLGDCAADTVPAITAALEGVAARHAPIAARFVGAGTFGERPRVLWVGLGEGAEALAAVYRDLVPALSPLGFAPDHEGLTPHLTLARAGDRGGDPGLAAAAAQLAQEDFGAARFGAMVLYRSELSRAGASYTALATAPFRGGAADAPGRP